MPLPWRLKVFDGVQFVNAECRRWDGTSWVATHAYFFDGAQWVLCTDRTPPTQTYTFGYRSIWAQTYQNNNTKRGDTGGNTSCYQGKYTSTWGIQKSMWGLPSSVWTNIQGAVAFYSNRVFISNIHTYYNAGGTAVVGTHTVQNSEPATFSYNRYGISETHFAKGEAKWLFYGPVGFGQWTAAGTVFGFTLFANSTDVEFYGYYSTAITFEHSFEK